MRDIDLDRFRLARINGAAGHYAHLRELTSEQEGEALASITMAAAGRTDLLAHAAGIRLGFHEGTTGEARAPYRRADDQGRSRPAPDPALDRGRPPPRSSQHRRSPAVKRCTVPTRQPVRPVRS